jgi:hypothetical protein
MHMAPRSGSQPSNVAASRPVAGAACGAEWGSQRDHRSEGSNRAGQCPTRRLVELDLVDFQYSGAPQESERSHTLGGAFTSRYPSSEAHPQGRIWIPPMFV